MAQSLFTVPLVFGAAQGLIEVKTVAENVYLMEFALPPDNRLVAPFWKALMTALDILEYKYPSGVLITTSSIAKFYSNGYDLEHISGTPRFMEDYCLPALRRLLTYPMPTIALINGHAFGAGVFLALAHDYKVQNPSKGFLCLPEVDMGILIPFIHQPIAHMCQNKMSPLAYRTMALEGPRVPAKQALELGVVDVLGGLDECLKLAADKKLIAKGAAGAWGGLKEDLYRETLKMFENYAELVQWRQSLEDKKMEIKNTTRELLKSWEEQKSKL